MKPNQLEDSGNKIYNKLGKLIKAVDDLRDCGLNEVLNLPKIVVLGSQSSGKSSVLESIIGIDCLPRGDGVVTRRPLELRLVHLPYQENSNPYAIFDEIKNEKFSDFSLVKKKIEWLTDKEAGSNKNIINKPIKLSIYSNTCPDMTLIDLPGITRIKAHNSDQPENIYEITKNMAESFCKEDSCIILAVIPANQDLTTSEALQMAMQLDPKGIRTIGVITKIDIMDKGTDAKKTILGEEVKLNLGYVGVKNRSQADINNNLTVDKALQREKEYFQGHPVYSKMERSYYGTDSLVEKLKVVFMGHLKSYLPLIYNNVKEKLNDCSKQLNQLGGSMEATLLESNKMSYMNNLINEFCESVEKVLSGKKIINNIPYHNIIRKNYVEFLINFKNDYSPSKSINNEELTKLLRMSEGTDMSGFPSSRILFTLLDKDFQEVREEIDRFYSTISGILNELVSIEIESIFKRFPKLTNFISETCCKFIDENANKSKELSTNISEMNFNYLYVDENIFQFEKIMNEMYKSNSNPNSKSDDYFKSLGEYSKQILDQYFAIVIRNLREFIPKTWGHFFVRTLKEKLRGHVLSEVTKQDIMILLEESPDIAEKVAYYTNLYKILKNSERILASDPEIKQFIKDYNLKPKIETIIEPTVKKQENDIIKQVDQDPKLKKVEKEVDPKKRTFVEVLTNGLKSENSLFGPPKEAAQNKNLGNQNAEKNDIIKVASQINQPPISSKNLGSNTEEPSNENSNAKKKDIKNNLFGIPLGGNSKNLNKLK